MGVVAPGGNGRKRGKLPPKPEVARPQAVNR